MQRSKLFDLCRGLSTALPNPEQFLVVDKLGSPENAERQAGLAESSDAGGMQDPVFVDGNAFLAAYTSSLEGFFNRPTKTLALSFRQFHDTRRCRSGASGPLYVQS
jgi:hypothetical protein